MNISQKSRQVGQKRMVIVIYKQSLLRYSLSRTLNTLAFHVLTIYKEAMYKLCSLFFIVQFSSAFVKEE